MISVYGASDDLIEIEGDIREELNALAFADSDDGGLLGFSNGVVLRILYDADGVWRIAPVHQPKDVKLRITQAPANDDDNYSDIARMPDDIEWVLIGSELARKQKE